MKPPPLSPLAYRRLCLVAVVALAAIVVTGGAVRLTGSGLGCSTWPQCEPGSYTSAIAFRPLVEFGNRMVTIAVGVITAAVAGGSLLLRPRRRDLVWLAWGLVLGYVAQAVLGGLTVLYKLSPLLVMGHFLVSMLLLWDAILLHRRAGQRAGTRPRSVVGPELRWLARLLVGTAGVVLVVGTFVSGTGPHSGDLGTHRLGLISLRDISQLHADFVLFLTGLTVATLVALQVAKSPAVPLRWARILLVVIVVQGAVGFAQYFLHLPSGLVGLHVAGATVFWVVTLYFSLDLSAREPVTAAEPVVDVPSRAALPV